MIVIGIDPGDHTGFAVWDTSQQAFLLLATLPLHKAMQEVVKWTTAPELAPQRKGKKVHVVCEDARQRTWFAPERNVSEYRGKLIRKIVCNGEERWFIGSDCAVTFMTMDECMHAIDQLA